MNKRRLSFIVCNVRLSRRGYVTPFLLSSPFGQGPAISRNEISFGVLKKQMKKKSHRAKIKAGYLSGVAISRDITVRIKAKLSLLNFQWLILSFFTYE